jgi:hypothetical protein
MDPTMLAVLAIIELIGKYGVPGGLEGESRRGILRRLNFKEVMKWWFLI